MKLRRRVGTDLANDLHSTVLPLEVSNRLVPNQRRFRFPTDEAQLGSLGAGKCKTKEKQEEEDETRQEFLGIEHREIPLPEDPWGVRSAIAQAGATFILCECLQ